MFYVSMTDSFLSGWGGAVGKKAILVICCDTPEKMDIALEFGRKRPEMTNIKTSSVKPFYGSDRYTVEWWICDDERLKMLNRYNAEH